MKKISSQQELNKSTICAQPWFGVVVDSDGFGAVCCEMSESLEGAHVKTHSFNDFQNHKKVIRIRNQMINGEKPLECWRCFEKEEKGSTSQRQYFNRAFFAFNDTFDSEKIYAQNIELRLGNLCQLQCFMCSPIRSAKLNEFSKIAFKSFTEVYPITDSHQKLFDWVEDETIWDKIIDDSVKDSRRIYINGGEPLLSKLHMKIIEKIISTDRAKDIILSYSTNVFLITQEIIDLWKQFKTVQISLSIDGVYEKIRYLRYPSDWKQLVTKLELIENNQSDNLNFSVWCTLSLLNFRYFTELFEYFSKNHPKMMVKCRAIQTPSYLSPINLPQELKETEFDKLKSLIIEYHLEWNTQVTNEFSLIVKSMPDFNHLKQGIKYYLKYADYHKFDLELITQLFPDLII